jgi:hypothetical protein
MLFVFLPKNTIHFFTLNYEETKRKCGKFKTSVENQKQDFYGWL